MYGDVFHAGCSVACAASEKSHFIGFWGILPEMKIASGRNRTCVPIATLAEISSKYHPNPLPLTQRFSLNCV
jgi:hypothetical protein